MKKFIAVAAGLALAGTMATSAMAEVTFGGSARARAITMMDYTDGGSISKIDSRVRLKVSAKAKGGAFAKARIRLADGMWDGGNGATGNAADDHNIYVDYGYVGATFGTVTITAGRQIANFSKWFGWDGRKDRLKLLYKNAGTTVALFYDKNAELTDSSSTTAFTVAQGGVTVNADGSETVTYTDASTSTNGDDWTADNDKNGYGVVVAQKFGDFKAAFIAIYGQDETPTDNNFLVGSLNLSGKAGGLNMAGEISMKDFDSADDRQIGGYVSLGANMGAMSITGIAGMTKDGFMADNDFGTHMIGNGNNSPITYVSQIGTGGDTVFGVLALGFKVSDQLALNGFLTYATVDDFADLIEVSGGAVYTVSDGAALTLAAGAVMPSDEGGLGGYDDTAFGAYAKFEVKY